MDYYNSLNASLLDPNVPTIFELLSSQQLDGLLSPSLRYLIVFYAQRYPARLLRIANRFDELYLLLMGAVNLYHLRHWNASFIEKFYGLKRVRILNVVGKGTKTAAPQLYERMRRLTKKQILGSLLVISLVPYIEEKLEARYEKVKANYAFGNDSPQDTIQAKLDKILFNVYPLMTFSRQTTSVLFTLSYLFTKSRYSCFSDWLLGTQFSRLTQFDYDTNDLKVDKSKQLAQSFIKYYDDMSTPNKIVSLIASGYPVALLQEWALTAMNYALPTSMFIIKLLEWWHASDLAKKMAKKARGGLDESLDIPQKHSDLAPSSDSSLCPLCHGPIQSPTAIETGKVFCYMCIYNYLEKGGKNGGRCPVTGQRLLSCVFSDGKWTVGGLRRLMI